MRDARITALKAMLDADPMDPFALYGLALEYKVAGELELALPLLKAAVSVEEPAVYAYYQLGEVLIGLGETDEAEDALNLGIQRAHQTNDQKAAHELAALLDTL